MFNKINDFFTSERGDTNYVAIVILIVLLVCAAIGMRMILQQGLETVRQAIENFLHGLGF